MAHDFGRVIAGAVLQHTFTFTNVGDRLLELPEVRSSCGCTTAAQWLKRVEPGQSGNLPIEFRTGGFDGAVTKLVTVGNNDGRQSNLVLQVKASVWHPIRVSPASAGLRVVSDQVSNTVAVLRIVNNEDTPLTLSEPESDQPTIAAELRTVDPGRTFELTVLAATSAESGSSELSGCAPRPPTCPCSRSPVGSSPRPPSR